MKHSFLYDADAWIIVVVLFVLMFSAEKFGYRIGLRKSKPDLDASGILSSLLGLLALLLAFTFSMAGSRYDQRKANMVQEANDIGTAILRSDVYPDTLATAFKKDFKNYLDARIAYFSSERDKTKIALTHKNAAEASGLLWHRATKMAKNKDFFIQSQMMLPALNDMFDSASATNASFISSVPESIVYLLLIFSIVISFYIGYSSGFKKQPEIFFVVGFCMLTCIVIFITLDLDRPRRGTINLINEVALLEGLKSNF
jgi:hypothetical protein